MPTFHAPPLRPRDVTVELELDAIEAHAIESDDPTLPALDVVRPPAPDREADAARALRQARLSARVAREDGRVEDAITHLKRALHATRDRAACRAIFGELADIYASQGERGEASYYAKRAGRPVPREPARPVRAAGGGPMRPPPPPPRARLS